jgi:hypothetical protein
MSNFIYRLHKRCMLCMGGTNVSFLATGGTNVASYFKWHKCHGGSGTNVAVNLMKVAKKLRHLLVR